MELWNGKAMHWGEEFLRRNVDEVAESVDKALEYGDLLNLYMFHGGTTFGFMNGANDFGKYVVQMSSYDVDAPLNEYGKRTSKYYAEQEVICHWRGITPENTAKDPIDRSRGRRQNIGIGGKSRTRQRRLEDIRQKGLAR